MDITNSMLYEDIRSFNNHKENLASLIQKFIMDASIPYEYRKAIWTNTPKGLEVGDGIPSLPNYCAKYGKISWYDEVYADRYETIHLPAVIWILEDRGYSRERIDLFISDCMADGTVTFVYAW